MNIRFQHTDYLYALAVVPLLVLLYWQLLRWKKKTAARIGDARLVKELTADYAPRHFLFKYLALAIALVLVIFGAANLQKLGIMDKVQRRGLDVVIALDVSKSMLAQDIKPNRLERARQVVYRLMDRLSDDRIGLVLFAGRAYLQMPLTTDHGAARMYVQQAGPDVVPTQGTVIAEALKMSNAAFNSKERKYKSIVLITDGEDHDPEAMELSKNLADNGVMVNTVGIGSAEGAPIMDPTTNEFKKDEAGNTVISKLNEEELKQLAVNTKGVYVHLDNIDDAVNTIAKQLSTIEQDTLEDSAFKDYKNYFYWFLGVALVLLIAEFFFPEKRWKTS